MIDLKEKKAKRFQVLKKIYEDSEGDELKFLNFHNICNELKIPKNEISPILNYLRGEMLIETRTIGGEISITHEGVKEVEDAIENPDKPTEHFLPINSYNINVQNMNNSQIQQGTVGSTQTQSISITNDVTNLLELLLTEISNETADQSKKDAAIANAQIVKSQSELPEEYRDKTLIKKAWNYLSNASTLISVGNFLNNHGEKITTFFGF